MQRNLFGISARGVVLRAASGLYAIVFCQAIVHDSLWLWILSIAGGLIILALFGAPAQDYTTRVKQPPGAAFIDPIEALGRPGPGQWQLDDARRGAPLRGPARGFAPRRQAIKREEGRSIPRRQDLTKERRQALQLILLDSPPICLN